MGVNATAPGGSHFRETRAAGTDGYRFLSGKSANGIDSILRLDNIIVFDIKIS